MRSSLVIDVEECGVEPQGEMRDDARKVLFLSSDDDGEACPKSKRQRSEGSRYFADKMKIHRLNHELSCMVRAKTDVLEQRHNFFKGPRLHYLSLRGAFSLVLRRLIANVGARAIVASLQSDLHRTTVNRWEIVFHACLVSSWRRYEQMRQDMTARLDDDSEGKHVSRFEVHVARAMRPIPAKQPRSIRWRSSRCS